MNTERVERRKHAVETAMTNLIIMMRHGDLDDVERVEYDFIDAANRMTAVVRDEVAKRKLELTS